MAYVFSGVMAPGGPGMMGELLATFGGQARAFEVPFTGFAAAFHSGDGPSNGPHHPDTTPLRAFSKRWPHVPIVYVYVECIGGVCDQTGFTLLAGRAIAREAWARDNDADSPLVRLFGAVGMELASSRVPALARGYFQQSA